jgi:lysine-specific demethylase 3
MCRRCGREACAECFVQVRELTVDRPGASGAEIAALQSRRDKHAHSNPFFLSCTKRNEHQASDFSPVSRFCTDELGKVVEDMVTLLAEPDLDDLPAATEPAVNGSSQAHTSPEAVPQSGPDGPHEPSSALQENALPPDQNIIENGEASLILEPPPTANGISLEPQSIPVPDVASVPSGHCSEIPSHETTRFVDAELTDDVFRAVWSRGEPIVVTGILPKFKVSWEPDYFIEKYNSQNCLIIECRTDVNKRVTVGEFFSWFGKYEERTDCWKLKVGSIYHFFFTWYILSRSQRTGPHRLSSKRSFQNFMRIFVGQFRCQTMSDVMEC